MDVDLEWDIIPYSGLNQNVPMIDPIQSIDPSFFRKEAQLHNKLNIDSFRKNVLNKEIFISREEEQIPKRPRGRPPGSKNIIRSETSKTKKQNKKPNKGKRSYYDGMETLEDQNSKRLHINDGSSDNTYSKAEIARKQSRLLQ